MSEGNRVKRWAPKVFSGCQTCKKRRIKCDEGKPTCQRCARSGLQCEGYAPPTARMFEPGKKNDRAASQDRGLAIRQSPRTAPASSPFKTPDETHSFEFYMRKTADLVSIYSHRHFWTIIIPQATHRHTAVKHSVLALSTLHESLSRFDSLSEDFNTQLFDHYNKAIRAFTHSQPPTDIVLITCILFWTVENFNGFGRPSFDHMEAAQKILLEFKADKGHDKSPHYDLITTYIEPIIQDCMQHVRTSNTAEIEAEEIQGPYASAEGTLPSRLPMKFPTLDTAQVHLRACVKTLLHALNTDLPNDEIEALLEQLDLHLRRWIYLFHNLTAMGVCCVRRMLVVHHINASALLTEIQRAREPSLITAEDLRHHYRWTVNEIVDLVEEAEKADPALIPSPELGAIPPLFTAAIRSQDPELRVKAVDQLMAMKRREGFWTDELAARIAQTLIQAQGEGVSGVRLNNVSVFASEYGLGVYSKDPAFERFIGGTEEEIKQYDMTALNQVMHNYGYQLDNSLRKSPTA